jgi:hypothetical protein
VEGCAVAAGATSGNTTAISLTPENGFTGTVNLSRVVNTNLANPTDLPGCALSPAAVNITGSTNGVSSLTVSTIAPTGIALGLGPLRIGGAPGSAVLVSYSIEAQCAAADGDCHRSGCFDRGSRLWWRRRRVSKHGRGQLRNDSRELLRYRDWDRCRNRKDHRPDNGERYCQWIAVMVEVNGIGRVGLFL